ncbi:MAG: leucine-rich repeat domain-containing protein [Bacteroides sp.]|nr:leucine-rich repeat domain-containing protein [Bacteroides sp.]
MKLNRIIAGLALYICLPAFAQQTQPESVKKSLRVDKAGTLVEHLTLEEANKITHLTLEGKLNAVDFRHLRDEFTHLQVLDLTDISISLHTGKGGTYPDKFYLYPANTIPAYAFCRKQDDTTYIGKQTLTKIILPRKVNSIEDAAFKGCTSLQTVQLLKPTAPNLFAEALADSITAIFIPKGSYDAYRSKARWETFTLIEGKPCYAHVQIAKMESLASALLAQGIQPKEVNYLIVEGKLDDTDFKIIRDYMPNLVYIDLSRTHITTIPEYTFTQKKYLMKVILPHSLRSIGQRAFSGCIHLRGTLILPPTIAAIEYGAFIGCDNLTQVVATGNKITTLGDQLFGEAPSKLVYQKQ